MHLNRTATRCLAALCVLRISAIPAQQGEPLRQPAAIPAELASALIAAGGFGMSGDPQILVGEMPEWITSRVHLPHGTRVLGSAFFGSTVVGVLSIPTTADSALALLQRELLARAWRSPVLPQMGGGGFRPSRSGLPAMMSERPTLCSDQYALTMWMSRQQALATTVIMRVASAGASICSASRGPVAAQPRVSPMPTLYNPEGADADMAARECYAMYRSSGTETRLRTHMKSEAILEHYARQLQDSGWTRAGQAPAVIGQIWTRTDSTHGPRVLVLTVHAAPNDTTCRKVEMGVQQSRER